MGNKSEYLAGKLLLSMPTMGDPRFEKSVIFVCAHDEHGAMGLVINHKVPGLDFSQLLEQLNIKSDIQLDLQNLHVPIMQGGPVESSRGFLLHSGDFKQTDTVTIDESFAVTGTVDALKLVAEGEGPKELLFILGYAGWSAGQLEQELQENSWLVVDPDLDLVFRSEHDDKWMIAMKKLGIDPGMLSGTAGQA